MTAPSQTPAVPAPASPRPVAADLRKDDPRTAVDLWKRRLAATPDAVAFRYYDRDAWQGMTFRRGRRDCARDRGRAGCARRRPRGSGLHRVADARGVGAVRRRDHARRGDRGPDLRLEHRGAVRVHRPRRRRQDRAGRGRGATGQAGRPAQQAVHGRAPGPAHGRGARRADAVAFGRRAGDVIPVRAVAGGAARGGTAVGRGASGRAGRARRDRGAGVDVHDHLHVGDDRRAQGRRADAREPDRGHIERDPLDADRDDRRAVPVPAAGPRAGARAASGARSRWAARRRSRAAPR